MNLTIKFTIGLILIFTTSENNAQFCTQTQVAPNLKNFTKKIAQTFKIYENKGPQAMLDILALESFDKKYLLTKLGALPMLPQLKINTQNPTELILENSKEKWTIDFCLSDYGVLVVNQQNYKFNRSQSIEFISEMLNHSNQLGKNLEKLFPLFFQNIFIPRLEANAAGIAVVAVVAALIISQFLKSNTKAKNIPLVPSSSSHAASAGHFVPSETTEDVTPTPAPTPRVENNKDSKTSSYNPLDIDVPTPTTSSSKDDFNVEDYPEDIILFNAKPDEKCKNTKSPSNDSLHLSAEETKAFKCFSSKHEFDGNKENLVQWNADEKFLSLGLGHYIWYPSKSEKHAVESFPALIKFICKNNYKGKLPKILNYNSNRNEMGDNPWHSKDDFTKAIAEKKELVDFLSTDEMMAQQVAFQYDRLSKAIESYPEDLKTFAKEKLKDSSTKLAMLDYVNFKGEGTSENEVVTVDGEKLHYGLKQVLEEWKAHPNSNFSTSAKSVLARRAKTNPQFMDGWNKRLDAYNSILACN